MAVVQSPSKMRTSFPRSGPCGDQFNSFSEWVYVFSNEHVAIRDGYYHVVVEGDTIQVLMMPFQSFRAGAYPDCHGTFNKVPLAAEYASGAPLCHGDEIREPTLVTVRLNHLLALITFNGLVSDFLFEGDDVEEVDGFLFWSELFWNEEYTEPITTAATRDAKRRSDMPLEDAILHTKRIRVELGNQRKSRCGRVITPPNVYIKTC